MLNEGRPEEKEDVDSGLCSLGGVRNEAGQGIGKVWFLAEQRCSVAPCLKRFFGHALLVTLV